MRVVVIVARSGKMLEMALDAILSRWRTGGGRDRLYSVSVVGFGDRVRHAREGG